jgi:hypothetical protein
MVLLQFHMGISFVSALTQLHTIRFCLGKMSEKFHHVCFQIVRILPYTLTVSAETILLTFIQSHFTPVNAVNTTQTHYPSKLKNDVQI